MASKSGSGGGGRNSGSALTPVQRNDARLAQLRQQRDQLLNQVAAAQVRNRVVRTSTNPFSRTQSSGLTQLERDNLRRFGRTTG